MIVQGGHPGVIGDNTVNAVCQSPNEVEQEDIATPQGSGIEWARLIMGIASMGIDSDDWGMLAT
jgi:hypothetical protein